MTLEATSSGEELSDPLAKYIPTPLKINPRAMMSGYWLLCLALALSPNLLLFRLIHAYYVDWHLQIWMVNYFAAFIRAHGAFPSIYDTTQYAGVTSPIYYSPALFKVLGTIGTLAGGELAFRILAIGLTVAIFFATHELLCKITSNRLVAVTGACLCVWSTYTLTDLYNRSDLTEYSAISLLTLSTILILRNIVGPRPGIALFLAAVLTTATALSVHAITTLFGGLFLGTIAVIWFPAIEAERRVRLTLLGLTSGLLAAAIQLPWLYLLFLFRQLAIYRTASVSLIEGIDTPLNRLVPIPFDGRVTGHDISTVSTPFLDAQVNVPMLALIVLLTLCLFSRTRGAPHRWLLPLVASLALATVLTWASISGTPWRLAPSQLQVVQYGYRLVAYVNLSLISALVASALLARDKAAASVTQKAITAAVLVFAAVGLVIKLTHGAASWLPETGELDTGSLPALHFVTDYSDPEDHTALALNDLPEVDAPFAVGTGTVFGELSPVNVSVSTRSLIVTNAIVFPWSQIRLVQADSGASSSDVTLGAYNDQLAAIVSPGTYTVEYSFAPTSLFQAFSAFSNFALAACMFGMCALLGYGTLIRTGVLRVRR